MIRITQKLLNRFPQTLYGGRSRPSGGGGQIYAVSLFRVCILWRSIWMPIISQRHAKGCPNLKAPPNAPHKCGLLFPLLGGCTATILHGLTYPKILCALKKKEKMATSLGVNHDERVKYLVTQPGSAPKARLSYLTTADAVNKVFLKDSPSKTAKAGSFKGCRPWIETCMGVI